MIYVYIIDKFVKEYFREEFMKAVKDYFNKFYSSLQLFKKIKYKLNLL